MSLELLGAEHVGGPRSSVGVDFMQILKGAAGALSGAGNLMSGGGTSAANQAAILEQQRRIEEERRQAEERAHNVKLGLGIGAGVLGVLMAGLLLRGGR